jgi:haloacid dehalogenase superfamily, subfamily IA, variant 3 with third motif having DD or ED/haloacid dehalogenase superfamily, subfamily IA, variant 1 with third motif having Dx(3-4)D or Dx(3-4)E
MYQAVIFDLDGTLLNTLEDLRDGVNHALRLQGYQERSLEEVRRFVGNGIWKLIERAVPEGVEEEKREAVFQEFRSYYTSHCRVKTRPYEGIIELLQLLKQKKVAMAIVSNKNDAAVKKLAKYYFSDFIDVAIGEREGIRKKPAPDSVYEAMRLLGAEKGQTVYVGDSDVDRETAANAGLDCVSVTWGFREEEMLKGLNPEYLIRKPEELAGIFSICAGLDGAY